MRHIDNLSPKELELLEKGSKYPLSIFRLLGYVISFYAGGLNLEKGIIDSIYTYDFEENNKSKRIYQLEKLCHQVIDDIEIENDITITTQSDSFNKSTTYTLSSHNVCNYLRSINKEFSKDDLSTIFIRLVKPTIGLYPLALLQRLEFLVGSYINHQTDIEGEWRFANNLKKFKIILDFLYVLTDEEDTIQTSSFFRTPHIHRIKLNVEGELWNTIKSRILN